MTDLSVLAKEINHRLEQAEGLDAKAHDHRTAAALQLAEARKATDEAGIGWEQWCAENIRRSQRDIRRLLAIGQSSDPERTAADQRAEIKDSTRRSRAADMYVRSAPKEQTPLGRALEAVNALPPDQRREVAKIAEIGAQKVLAAPRPSSREALIAAIDGVDDETLLDVFGSVVLARLKLRLTPALPAHDPETGEVLTDSAAVEEIGQKPQFPAPFPANSAVEEISPAPRRPNPFDQSTEAPTVDQMLTDDPFEIPAICDRRGEAA